MAHDLSFTPEGERDIVIGRTFPAPPARVFQALTTPADIRRWALGPPGHSFVTCENDPRPGGAIHYVWRQPDGTEMGLRGTYSEVEAPRHMVHTERFDVDWTGGETTVTSRLDPVPGGTRLTTTIRYQTGQGRDGAAGSGMREGIGMSYDRLAAMVAEGGE